MSRAVLGLLLLAGSAWAAPVLPVFLADNHAESFAWMSRTLELDREHVLVLTDAHSDASAAERSEQIREQLRRVASPEARAERVEGWRAGGRIQAFNWIEPLMPRPFGEVRWIAPCGDFARLRSEAGHHCDGRLEVEPRSAGTMAARWQVGGVEEMEAWDPGSRPVVWSLDLDFFAGMSPLEAEETFGRLWVAVMDWPGLCGVSVAVSRPWLAGDAQADRLVAMLLSAVDRTRGAVIEIDARVDDRPDDSLRARQGGVVRWDLAKASPVVGAWIALLGGRCRLEDSTRALHFPAGGASISVEGAELDLDGVWRRPTSTSGKPPVLRLRGADGSGRVRWFELKAARDAYDLLPETGLGKGFSVAPGRWVHERAVPLGESTDFAWVLDGDVSGRRRIAATYEKDGRWLPGGTVEVRTLDGVGVRGELTGCLGMPYVFGVAGVSEDGLSGVDGGWGADCSNVLVHAWRRCGEPLAWGDPEGLRRQLRPMGEELGLEDLARGVMVDFGRHVAMLIDDREPRGRVGPEDRVFHHLGGLPEVVALAELQQGRPPFRLWTLPRRSTVRVRVAGDVVPVGDFEAVEGFAREPGDELFLANLEGVPSGLAGVPGRRHDFRFPPERLAWLRERGVDAVSLANNHAGDTGADGLVDALGNLRAAGVGAFGAGRNAEEACRPWMRGKVACFGVSTVSSPVAGEGPGVACLPQHAERVEREMRAARRRGESVVVLVHGGDEYRHEVNDVQRRWARWLVARGAALVVGAGPHVVQREERHGGAVVAHSLGNAVYPKPLKGADSGRVGVWQLAVGE